MRKYDRWGGRKSEDDKKIAFQLSQHRLNSDTHAHITQQSQRSRPILRALCVCVCVFWNVNIWGENDCGQNAWKEKFAYFMESFRINMPFYKYLCSILSQ